MPKHSAANSQSARRLQTFNSVNSLPPALCPQPLTTCRCRFRLELHALGGSAKPIASRRPGCLPRSRPHYQGLLCRRSHRPALARPLAPAPPLQPQRQRSRSLSFRRHCGHAGPPVDQAGASCRSAHMSTICPSLSMQGRRSARGLVRHFGTPALGMRLPAVCIVLQSSEMTLDLPALP